MPRNSSNRATKSSGKASPNYPWDGVYLAIVSHIVDDLYEIVSVRSTTKLFVPGELFPLAETLCRDVFAKGITIALTHIAREPGQSLHHVYENMDIEAFISTPIYKRGEIWGTLNFTNLKIKKRPIYGARNQLHRKRRSPRFRRPIIQLDLASSSQYF